MQMNAALEAVGWSYLRNSIAQAAMAPKEVAAACVYEVDRLEDGSDFARLMAVFGGGLVLVDWQSFESGGVTYVVRHLPAHMISFAKVVGTFSRDPLRGDRWENLSLEIGTHSELSDSNQMVLGPLDVDGQSAVYNEQRDATDAFLATVDALPASLRSGS